MTDQTDELKQARLLLDASLDTDGRNEDLHLAEAQVRATLAVAVELRELRRLLDDRLPPA